MMDIQTTAILLFGAGTFLGWVNGSSRPALALNAIGFGLILAHSLILAHWGA